MRSWILCLLVIPLLIPPDGHAQKRNNQWEIFAGAAVPLAPEGIEDVVNVGFSLHGQYVIFLTPKFGLSIGIAGETFTENDDLADAGVDGELKVAELGIGLRPYLTPLASSVQFFLFGMGTYNRVEATFVDELGFEVNADERKPGVAFGAGLELPFGPKFNLLLQGLTRVIFTEGESFSFIGITAGIAR